ncbi:(2Fe-2S)-binding protein [Jiella avicenniae]|uniref:(2Fe-2S)-binding protein n=1 Tax=Jiella avicenniae TaxID=2907202 RepID=A0A9X1NXC9_9HYPH|nr:(2Fe-2S)-binding protein [Jiella avicenniae]MCE7027540.1 (2Fe-2S)-binding protein [Jiella avicenniae]
MPKLNRERRHAITFRLNGREVTAEAEGRMLLTDVLRHVVGATGTHVGCEHGVCGACTVQLDGEPVRACLMLAAQAEGADIRTVEGLEPAAGELSPLQAAFREHFALQCGFCTAGILMSLDALLTREPDASEEAIREHLSGHLCRCTGYAPIVKAALAAQARMKEETPENA